MVGEKGKNRLGKFIIFLTIGLILVFILDKLDVIPFGPFPLITLIVIGFGVFVFFRIAVASRESKQFTLEDFILLSVMAGGLVVYFFFFGDLALDFSTQVARPTLSFVGIP